MNEAIHRLQAITSILLEPSINYTAVRNASIALSELFYNGSGFDDQSRENQAAIRTSTGVAVDPVSAAFCVTDMMRTRNFLQGIKEAIETRLETDPGKPVIILYAGTGPFATLLTPLTTVFTPAQLQLVLLEINPLSIVYLQKLVERLELAPYITAIVQADATRYLLPHEQQPDILVSETMKAGLEKEPWVSIAAHLLRQCKKKPLLIPASVKIELCLAGGDAVQGLSVLPLKTLLDLTAETALSLQEEKIKQPVFSEGLVVVIDEVAPAYDQLILSTSIQVFNRHKLHLNECGITIAHRVMDTRALRKVPASLLFRYEMGDNPGFIMTEL